MIFLRTDATVDAGDAAEVWPLYREVFADHDDEAGWLADVWDRHARRDGFRLVRAYEGTDLVGFAYGYTGRAGQWWTDNVAASLGPTVADAWLGGHFEVVSVGVREDARRRGTGQALLNALLRGLPQERRLLQTSEDPADPAHLMYASEGWQLLGPGTGPATVVLGIRAGDGGAETARGVRIYHLALRSDWDDAVAAGVYRVSTIGATIDEVGFIHASREDQLQATAQRFYADLGVPLVLLVLDRDRLESGGVPVVDDPVGDDTFPHLYAALPVPLVDEAREARVHDGVLQH